MRAHAGVQRQQLSVREAAEDLLRFLLHLFFFAADKGNDVAKDVHRRDARITRAGNSLHRAGEHQRSIPNCASGASAMVSTMVEQFGLVTIMPFQPRFCCCSVIT